MLLPAIDKSTTAAVGRAPRFGRAAEGVTSSKFSSKTKVGYPFVPAAHFVREAIRGSGSS
eukprot:6194389-Pleurochrysis_carterae.AAC.1